MSKTGQKATFPVILGWSNLLQNQSSSEQVNQQC